MRSLRNSQQSFWQAVIGCLKTAAAGAGGFLAFYEWGLPLPFLLGPLSAVFLASLSRFDFPWPAFLKVPARLCLGLVAGLAFTPALLGRLPQLVASLALLIPMTALSVVLGYLLFVRVARFDRATAFYSAMPGGFQDMVAMGHDAGADVRKLSLIHSTRLVMLVYILPFWIIWSEGLSHVAIAVPHAARALTLYDVLLLGGAAIGGRWIASRLKLSGATVVGPMLLAAALSMSGLTDAHLPAPLIDAAQFILGIEIGTKFKGVSARDFFSSIAYGIVFTAILLLMAALAAKIAVWAVGVRWSSGLMAFSPGGQGEKNILAIALHADVAYVALHHLMRLGLVVIGAQILFRFVPADAAQTLPSNETNPQPVE